MEVPLLFLLIQHPTLTCSPCRTALESIARAIALPPEGLLAPSYEAQVPPAWTAETVFLHRGQERQEFEDSM